MEGYIPLFMIAAVVAVLAFRAMRYGGIKASFFGARITRTVGEIKMDSGRGLIRMKLRVHSLRKLSSPEPRVGIELTTTAVLSFNWLPLSLSREEALTLSRLLSQAVE